ncbi:MAG: DUF1893 domain-containing protein [Erysipelothrix sp.]|jgi:hypothetical protein|nr:DUF1893 domain-containing protein [Erysipelothrix sp.]
MTLEQLKTYLEKEDVVCAVYNGKDLLTSDLKGIRPWIQWLRECPERLEDAIVVDKVVGKAAAMLMVVAKIKALYTPIISEQAVQYLKHESIALEYDDVVEFISNANRNGMCVMEATVIDTVDAHEGYQQLLQKIQQLMQAQSQ